jgi:hypothetical protein
MTDPGTALSGEVLWLVAGVLAVVVGLLVLFLWYKGRPLPGQHVFRASRFSRGNWWFPTQVSVTPMAVIHYTPELFGGREHSMHISHVASVLIDRNLFFSDVLIESSGGASPVRCHGHRKADAVEMKRLIEHYQTDHLSRSR